MPRKVRISKVDGRAGESFPEGTVREGWEKEPPQVGKRYCVYLDNGKIYRTGFIRKVGARAFQTGYSVYLLDVLASGDSESLSS